MNYVEESDIITSMPECEISNIRSKIITEKYVHPNENFHDSAVIAKFEHENFKFVNPEKFIWHILHAIEYTSLHGTNYIEGSVIDSIILSKISSSDWINVFFYPASLTRSIIGDKRHLPWPQNFSGLYIKFEFKNKVFFTYCLRRHWQLLLLDVNAEEI